MDDDAFCARLLSLNTQQLGLLWRFVYLFYIYRLEQESGLRAPGEPEWEGETDGDA